MIKQTPPSEIIKIESGVYSLIFTDFECGKKQIVESGNNPDGHTWDLLIKSFCESYKIDMSGIDTDPESDMYCAYSDDYKRLENIALSIQKIINDPKTLEMTLKNSVLFHATNDDLSTSEYLNHLKEIGLNLTQQQEFEFCIEFPDLERAKKACIALEKEAYKCTLEKYDDEVFLSAVVSIIPEINDLDKRSVFFEEIAKKYNGDYSDWELKRNYDIINEDI